MQLTSKTSALTTLLLSTCLLAASAQAESYDGAEAKQTSSDARANFSMGNGEQNWIVTENAGRSGNVLTFKEVTVANNAWLVMHPFEDGKPNGDKYVAATYVAKGTNADVAIEVFKGIESGEHFIVMLHNDSNENEIFDFVFVDDTNVMDRAVFEGSRMIGHVFSAP